MARRKTAKNPRSTATTPKPASTPYDPAALDAVIALFVKGFRPERIAELLAADKSATIPAAAVTAYIAEARRLVTLAADYDRDEELGRAIRRFHEVYADATTAKEHRCRIDAQKELCRLMRLYDDPEAAAAARGTTDSEAELGRILGHLEPLALAPPGTPPAELVRLAVEKLLDA